jgi:hypothetical protein
MGLWAEHHWKHENAAAYAGKCDVMSRITFSVRLGNNKREQTIKYYEQSTRHSNH